jgi:hypothetical protein
MRMEVISTIIKAVSSDFRVIVAHLSFVVGAKPWQGTFSLRLKPRSGMAGRTKKAAKWLKMGSSTRGRMMRQARIATSPSGALTGL